MEKLTVRDGILTTGVIQVRMSVIFLVVYSGEETIRYWLQAKVKERKLHI